MRGLRATRDAASAHLRPPTFQRRDEREEREDGSYCRRPLGATGKRLPPFTNPAEWLLDVVSDPDVAEQLCDAFEDACDDDPPTTPASSSDPTSTRRPARRRPRAGRPTRFWLLVSRSLKQVTRDATVQGSKRVQNSLTLWKALRISRLSVAHTQLHKLIWLGPR